MVVFERAGAWVGFPVAESLKKEATRRKIGFRITMPHAVELAFRKLGHKMYDFRRGRYHLLWKDT